jgi:hypothetical protein
MWVYTILIYGARQFFKSLKNWPKVKIVFHFRVIKDKVYEAYVKEKEEAKKDYQEAVRRGETAGHVEQR